QHPGQRVDQHPAHAQRLGHCAGVLPTGTTEGDQGVAGHVIATLHGDPGDGVSHVRHGDLQETGGDLLRGATVVDLLRELGELVLDHAGVQRLAAVAEDVREV